MTTYHLILKNGRVLDPSQDLDRVADTAFADGRVAAIGDRNHREVPFELRPDRRPALTVGGGPVNQNEIWPAPHSARRQSAYRRG